MKLAAALISAAVALSIGPAAAETLRNCAPREVIAARLAEKYGETPQVAGLSSIGTLLEVFASPDTGTWTVIQTTPKGTACLVAAGQDFTHFAGDPRPAGDPA